MTSQPRHRSRCLILPTILLAVLAPAAPASAITLDRSLHEVTVGSAVSFTGTVPGAAQGAGVELQSKEHRTWVPVATTTTTSSEGTFAVDGLVVRETGLFRYRAVVESGDAGAA